jgi:hypothetical protein
LLLRQFAATPKTRKKHPENDSGAGCPIGYKAQNPLKSRTFRKKIKADFSIKICCLFWPPLKFSYKTHILTGCSQRVYSHGIV